MIQYIEKGIGLHETISRAGHWLIESPTGWESSDDVAVQAIIDAYSLADARAPIIAAVKELAKEKILAFLPEWRQSNYNARMNELNEARFSRSLTEQEESELVAMRAAWEQAKAIRTASNQHEANLVALDSFAAILSYDITTGWTAG